MAGIYFDYVVVGACRAGLSCVEAIRRRDEDSSILLISKENSLPYKRTKLSKKLYQDYGPEDFLLHPEEWYAEERITLYLDAEAVDLAPEIYTLFLADGRKIGYGKLCIATGARPIPLPETREVLYLREKADGKRIHRLAESWKRAAVIGNGIQGVELTEQLLKMGKEVDLIAPDPTPLKGKVDRGMARRIADLLTAKGASLKALGFRSLDSLRDDYDGLVASIGIQPSAEWLEGSGVETAPGVVIDSSCRTTREEIWAAGDVAEPLYPFISGLWHGAEYTGDIAGRSMSGETVAMELPPFRMKLDLFDDHFYALWYQPGLEQDPAVESRILEPRPGIDYCRLFEREGTLCAALFSGEESIGKQVITPMAKQGASVEETVRAIRDLDL